MTQETERIDRTKSGLSPDLVNDRDVTPLYYQVYAALKERIRRGVFPSGSTLPGELELVKLFGVSRITIKRALNELASGGFVGRHRGRGTVVTFNVAAPVVTGNFDNLLDSLKIMGLGTAVRLIEHAIIKVPDDIQKWMNLPKGTKVQRAVRLRSIEGVPFSYLLTHVPAEIANTYRAEDLAEIPLLQLLERAGRSPAGAEQWITAVAADPVIAKALEIASGTPLLEIRRLMTDREGNVVEALQGFYRPERFQHHMKLSRRRRGGRDEWR